MHLPMGASCTLQPRILHSAVNVVCWPKTLGFVKSRHRSSVVNTAKQKKNGAKCCGSRRLIPHVRAVGKANASRSLYTSAFDVGWRPTLCRCSL